MHLSLYDPPERNLPLSNSSCLNPSSSQIVHKMFYTKKNNPITVKVRWG